MEPINRLDALRLLLSVCRGIRDPDSVREDDAWREMSDRNKRDILCDNLIATLRMLDAVSGEDLEGDIVEVATEAARVALRLEELQKLYDVRLQVTRDQLADAARLNSEVLADVQRQRREVWNQVIEQRRALEQGSDAEQTNFINGLEKRANKLAIELAETVNKNVTYEAEIQDLNAEIGSLQLGAAALRTRIADLERGGFLRPLMRAWAQRILRDRD